jgi:hypothetical protein
MRVVLAALLTFISGPAFANSSCKEQVDAAFAKLRDAGKFRLETTIKNKDGILKMQAEYVLPDRMHQTVTLGTDGVPMEMIVVGKKAWSNGGNGWAELPEGFAQTVANQIKDSVADAPKVSTDYKCEGDKEFEGKTYAFYHGVLAMPLPADGKDKGPRVSAVTVPNQQNIYIDKATGIPVRNIVTPVTAPDQRLFDGKFTVLKDLDIEPPKDVLPKEASPN